MLSVKIRGGVLMFFSVLKFCCLALRHYFDQGVQVNGLTAFGHPVF